MKIIINFLNGDSYWQDKVRVSSDRAADILSSPPFLSKVRSFPMFDFCADSPTHVGDKLESTTEIKINVGFYSKRWTKAIAYEEGGAVNFNTRKEAGGAGSAGNVAHEVMHALGYSHDGNSPQGQQHTVPYAIGNWVDEWSDAV